MNIESIVVKIEELRDRAAAGDALSIEYLKYLEVLLNEFLRG